MLVEVLDDDFPTWEFLEAVDLQRIGKLKYILILEKKNYKSDYKYNCSPKKNIVTSAQISLCR